jgi:hypothetical protein
MAGQRRIDVIQQSLLEALRTMARLSMRGSHMHAAYHVSVVTYSDRVHDWYDGKQSIERIAQDNRGLRLPLDMAQADSVQAFEYVEHLLCRYIPTYPELSPAPLVCHVTSTVQSPQRLSVFERIQSLQVADGPVLCEQVFIDDTDAIVVMGEHPMRSQGVSHSAGMDTATGRYAQWLWQGASHMPALYRTRMRQNGYDFSEHARMFVVGNTVAHIDAAFAMTVCPIHDPERGTQ